MATKRKTIRLFRQWGEDPLEFMGRFVNRAEAEEAAVAQYQHHFGSDKTGGAMFFYTIDGGGTLKLFEVDYRIAPAPRDIEDMAPIGEEE